MNVINQVYDTLKWKKNDQFCADKLEIPLKKYQVLKEQILYVKDMVREEADEKLKEVINKKILTLLDDEAVKAEYITALEDHVVDCMNQRKDKVIEFSENLEEGTANIKGVAFSEPKSPEEIIRVLKIDTDKWKLSNYWNKEHKDYWLVSALVTRKNADELSIEEAEQIIDRVFCDKNFQPIYNYPDVHNGKALFIYTSDKHIAAYVDHQRAIYANDFDELNYDARMKLIIHEVLYLHTIHGSFQDVYVIDLGDKMDGLNGYTTRGGHKLPQNMSNRKAFETALTVEKAFYDRLFTSGVAEQYHVIHNANSNHGGDFDYMVNRALEIYVQQKYPDVKTRVMEKFIEHLTYGKHTILLTHGKDDADLKHGLPMHLNDKAESYLNKYLMFHGINPQQTFVSVIKGDLHTNTSQDAYGFRYRNVLSLFGGSKWVGNNFGPCKPGCSFDIIEQDSFRVYEHRLFFAL